MEEKMVEDIIGDGGEGAAQSSVLKACWTKILAILAGAIILLMPTFLNKGVFLYWDTPTYINGAEMGVKKLLGAYAPLPPMSVVPSENPPAKATSHLTSSAGGVYMAGRSVYYGALLFVSIMASSLMIAAMFQALVVSYTILMFFWTFLIGRTVYALIAMVILTIASPLGYFVGLMMPDVFAGVTVMLTVILLYGWRRIGRIDKTIAFLILCFAMLAHNSYPPLILLLVIAACLFAWLGRFAELSLLCSVTLVMATIGVGVVGEIVFVRLATHAVGSPPVRLPFLSAHLQEMGPGTIYLKTHCPQAQFEICNDLVKLPVDWRDFMFSADPATGVFALADVSTKRRISDEQIAFALDVLKNQPVATIAGLSKAFAQQLMMFRLQEVYILGTVAPRLPAVEYQRAMHSVIARPGQIERVVTFNTYTVVILSVIALTVFWMRRKETSLLTDSTAGMLWPATALTITGLMLNAAVCGIVASPYDRFQARVIWLLPLLVLVHLAARKGVVPISQIKR